MAGLKIEGIVKCRYLKLQGSCIATHVDICVRPHKGIEKMADHFKGYTCIPSFSCIVSLYKSYIFTLHLPNYISYALDCMDSKS